jgi:ubiquinone/menaquinone biosynthesis C-methylase UbiE
MNNEKFTELLIESAQVDLHQRKVLEKRLAKEAPQHLNLLEELVADNNVTVRRGAVEVLRRITGADDRALQILLKRLSIEPDVKTRRRLAAAIADSERSEVSRSLVEHLEREEHRFVQASLILALGKLGFQDWPTHWLEFLGKEGPVAEAMRKAVQSRAPTPGTSPLVTASRLRSRGTYFFQLYPGLERLVQLELQQHGLGHAHPLTLGWLRLSDLTDSAIASLEHLRTAIADYCLAFDVPATSNQDINAIFDKATRAMLISAPYLSEGCTFRLSLPKMPTRGDYNKLVARVSRHIEQLRGWRNNPSNYDIDIRLLQHSVTESIIWRDRRWPSSRQNEVRLVVPASIHPSVAAALCFAAVELELATITSSEGKGRVLLDPCCGAGTILREWLILFPQAKAIGYDISEKAIELSRTNLAAFKSRCRVSKGDMRQLPLKDSSVDFIICNLPFGVRVKHELPNRTLYTQFAREASRVLRPRGWLLTYTSDRQAITHALRAAGWPNVSPLTKVSAGGLEVTIHRVQKEALRATLEALSMKPSKTNV